jgi:tRNA uridine 5-carboxymethylaminomethyl modification enzyme
VEPEGWDTVEVYVNGFSSSLPEDVQYEALRKVTGFENCRMFRPGYAIEYDYFPPTQLSPTLETRLVKNLFFAGQINGTTGYEEAASQGLIAGINAHLAIKEEAPFILKRSEAYIGVLIDDLINKGTLEPYRMFTSRAEHRILLRQDNADIRLTPLVETIGMKGLEERMERVSQKNHGIQQIEQFLSAVNADPEQINPFLESIGSATITQKTKLNLILSRPHIGIEDIAPYLPQLTKGLAPYDDETISLAEVNIKYRGYIEREQEMVDKMNRLEELALHDSIDYSKISSLSIESREKLSRLRPRTLGQASRISGVSPSDISVLLVHMGR